MPMTANIKKSITISSATYGSAYKTTGMSLFGLEGFESHCSEGT